MRAYTIARRVLLALLTALWVKLALDLVFFFSPESARAWFGQRAVISVALFSFCIASLNIYFLMIRDGCVPSNTFSKSGKAVVIAALLGSIFSCLVADTFVKLLDIYIVIPAIIILLVTAPESNISRVRTTLISVLALVLLWPNDTCENPQNWWWIGVLGSSPLTYILPVNALLLLTSKRGSAISDRIVLVLVGTYYLGSIYHRYFEGY